MYMFRVLFFFCINSLPKKSCVNLSEQKKILLKNRDKIIQSNLKYVKILYIQMSRELESRISPKALHLSAVRRFSDLFHTEHEECNIDETTTVMYKSQEIDETDFDKSEISLSSDSSDMKMLSVKNITDNRIQFSIFFYIHTWSKIQPIVSYSKREKFRPHYRKVMRLPKYKWTFLLK